MYITLEYEDGTKQSKQIDSGSTVSIDGVQFNANGENVGGPSVATFSCEGLTAIALTEEPAPTPEELHHAWNDAFEEQAAREQAEADEADAAAAAAAAEEQAAKDAAPPEVPVVPTPEQATDPTPAPATEKPKGRYPWSS